MKASVSGFLFLFQVAVGPAVVLAQSGRWPPPVSCYQFEATWHTNQPATARDSLLKPIRFSLSLSPSNPAVLNIAHFRADSAARMESALAIWQWEKGWIHLEARTRSDSISLLMDFADDSVTHGFAERRVIGKENTTAAIAGRRVTCSPAIEWRSKEFESREGAA